MTSPFSRSGRPLWVKLCFSRQTIRNAAYRKIMVSLIPLVYYLEATVGWIDRENVHASEIMLRN